MDIEKFISDSESSDSENEPEPVKPIKEQKKSAIERPKRILSDEQKLKMKLGREKKAAERKSSNRRRPFEVDPPPRALSRRPVGDRQQ